MAEVLRYDVSMKTEWNAFIRRSINGTFLFDRDYMDYHADRFTDHSLVFVDKGEIKALLPANISGSVLTSHGGLTYGGLIVDDDAKTPAVIDMFVSMNDMLRKEGITTVEYKTIPWIYHSQPAESDLYALFKVCKAQLIGRLVSSTVNIVDKIKMSYQRRRGVNKAKRNGLIVKETNDIEGFYRILDDNLMEHHHVHPVHTIDELRLLKNRFPEAIRLFMTFDGNEALAGTLLYITPRVIHTQYISASPQGKNRGALDILFAHFIDNPPIPCHYLDFGCSTEDMGHYLNEGLIHQKEGFGARGVCYDIYSWNI